MPRGAGFQQLGTQLTQGNAFKCQLGDSCFDFQGGLVSQPTGALQGAAEERRSLQF